VVLNIIQRDHSLGNDHSIMVPCVKITVGVYQACEGFKYNMYVMLNVTECYFSLDLVKSREQSWCYGALCENFR